MAPLELTYELQVLGETLSSPLGDVPENLA